MQPDTIVLQCSALGKAYGPKQALKNFTASFSAGRITGLLGPNGSGKTTLLKLAAGLLTPTSGSITVCGQAPGVWTKQRTAYLPDRPCLPQGRRPGSPAALGAGRPPPFLPIFTLISTRPRQLPCWPSWALPKMSRCRA